MELRMEIKRVGSQPSGKGPADWFSGTVREEQRNKLEQMASLEKRSVSKSYRGYGR
jgi:hypothetical protein